MEFGDAAPAETVTCTYVVASANQPLFSEERTHLPRVGDTVCHDGHAYRVLGASPQVGDVIPAGDVVAHPSVMVRIEPGDEQPETSSTRR